MPYVDPSRRVVPVETEAEIAAQAARPKLEVYQLDNGDGTFSYFQKVYLANEPVISGEVSLVVDGEAPDADTLPDGTPVPGTKLRLGIAGADDGYVARANPMPSSDNDTHMLLVRVVGLLELLVKRG